MTSEHGIFIITIIVIINITNIAVAIDMMTHN